MSFAGRALGFAVVWLAGCTVGPDYHAPAPLPGTQAPLLGTSAAQAVSTEPPAQWWQLYQDPALNELVQEAFRANTDLAVAAANLAAARSALEGARVGLYPQTKLDVATERGRDPTTDEILELTGRRPETFWFYDALLDVSYEVDLFGHVRRAIEAARADTDAAIAARDTIKITVAAETTRAYAQVCALGEAIDVARHSIEVVTHEQQITSDRRDAGAAADFDVVRAQALVAQVRAALPPLQGQRQSALFQLAQLLGRPPGGAPQSAQDCVRPPTLKALIPVGDGASLLARRPDVRQAERHVAGATARIGVATADLYPRISLIGSYGGVATQVSQVPQNVGLAWGIGPSISWSFPNQSSVRARIHQARAAEQAAVASFDGVVLQALKETDQSLATYGAELAHRQELLIARDRARQAFDMANDQFLAGATSTLDLLNAEVTVVGADQAVAASDGALAQDQIGVFKALGGGWQP
ncbi:MAG TPA: TolC family protein [Steroidobacteraceae bacterium]|jgi:NodT family efflux transporter outer membrane factor (OMF) lipoprotein|nr:TolC family protein [Steroidobacteraceae bacterium]